jgi:PPK2 family polyphosphate:nucleotide phosphotransferase
VRSALRVDPGSSFHLEHRDASATPHLDGGHAKATELLPTMHERALELHDRLFAEATRSVLIVLQGIDTSGKDGTISHVFRGLNPQGTRVSAFKQPSTTELAHDFLWRVHAACPRRGEIGIFNRSHYEDVIAPRVHGSITKPTWRRRYEDINAFERLLDGEGTTVVKIFLQISRDEQRRRLLERLDTPDKRWKFSTADIAERKLWPEYIDAYDEMISATSTELAPWYVVPADHKWYRNFAVSSILIDVLEGLDPHYPSAPEIGDITID